MNMSDPSRNLYFYPGELLVIGHPSRNLYFYPGELLVIGHDRFSDTFSWAHFR